jgi:hypothetical protein
MTEQGNGHGEEFQADVDTQPSRGRVITGSIESAVATLLTADSQPTIFAPGFPGYGLVNKAVDLVNFMPPTTTKVILAGVLGAGSALLAMDGVRRITTQKRK